MIAFFIRRCIQVVIVMMAVGLIAFSLFTYVGDPVSNMVGVDTTKEERLAIYEKLGLNDPFYVQYWHYLNRVIRGEFGTSFRLGVSVTELFRERLPATLELSAVAALFALLFGIPLGVYTGLHREGWASRLILTLSLIGISLPTFLIGILMIFLFGVILGWLPSFGRGDVVQLGFWSTGLLTVGGLKSLIMPAITLGLFQMTLILRLVRSEMLEVLRTDYIKFARARGLTNRAINFSHALKNTLVPVITITGLQLGGIIAFAIITETVFQWPGMGLLFVQAVSFVDIPVMSAYLMLVAFFFVLINLIVDMLYYLVDPRLRLERGAASDHG